MVRQRDWVRALEASAAAVGSTSVPMQQELVASFSLELFTRLKISIGGFSTSYAQWPEDHNQEENVWEEVLACWRCSISLLLLRTTPKRPLSGSGHFSVSVRPPPPLRR